MNNDIGPTLGRKPLGRIGYGAMRLPGILDVPEDNMDIKPFIKDA